MSHEHTITNAHGIIGEQLVIAFMKTSHYIERHIRADGPVSFDSIAAYVQQQAAFACSNTSIRQNIDAMVANGEIEVYNPNDSPITYVIR